MNPSLFDSMLAVLKDGENVLLTGLAGTAKSYVLHRLVENTNSKTLCLVPSEEKAYDLYRGLQGLTPSNRVFLFLGRELVFMKENYSQVEANRLLTLQDCLQHPGRSAFIVATPGAFMYPILSPEDMSKNTVEIKKDQEYPLQKLIKSLVQAAYQRVDTVTRPGEFAVRGGLLDIFPAGDTHPCRIEFFDDLVESMRRFDVDSQRSISQEQEISVLPADELAGEDLSASLMDYLGDTALIFFDEPREFYQSLGRSLRRYREAIREAKKDDRIVRELKVIDEADLRHRLKDRPTVYHSFFPGNIPQVKVGMLEHVSQIDMEPFYHNYPSFFPRIREWLSRDFRVILAIKSRTARQQMQKELLDQGISGLELTGYEVEKGFISPTLKLALVSEKDLWGKTAGRATGKTRKREERLLLEDLKLGDYVVHENYGIGIFRGVTQVEIEGVTREYVLLQYAGTDKLYLPLDKLDVLYKYTAVQEREPRLSKLGGNEWERTKKKVSQSIQEMAEELLRLYAVRESKEGYAFSPDTPWQRQFEDGFPHQETPDQLKAIHEVKRNMESRKPMDRLICGDVGYGKTEVAMRAAFKAIMDSKQVAVLVPTTVLAEQHLLSFRERFADYPATVEALSRFRTVAQQKRILNDVKKGAIDIVIGTHRLLSRDVQFRDLGLLIIDEEHRFGVAQKEKIKALKELVDVISLSATPIPRSLHMALTGLRDMSVIETPPPERYPITTYVMEYNADIVHDAIKTELDRGGQVFFVHNRIEDIDRVKEELENLVPGVNIGLGHGRMKEEELSRVMMDFMQGKYQIFLCTTIIESGLDMPNVNTMIIDEADKMGLAQLYQLRGRVGRSNRLAYAYLTYRPDKIISETAQKRLNAIREFSDLGSGMKIALRDLEIRGAGNILGSEQHGFIHAVGFDLYCRLLEQEAARLKGEVPAARANPLLDIDADYYIPESYIPDSGTKMRVYRRLLLAADQEEIEEISQELVDRFGELPHPVANFLQVASLRVMARDKEIKSLRRKGRQVEIQTTTHLPVDLIERIKGMRVKRINDYTLRLQMEKNSLADLHTVMSLI